MRCRRALEVPAALPGGDRTLPSGYSIQGRMCAKIPMGYLQNQGWRVWPQIIFCEEGRWIKPAKRRRKIFFYFILRTGQLIRGRVHLI